MKKYLSLIGISVLLVVVAAGYFLIKGKDGARESAVLYGFRSGEEVASVDIINTFGAFSFRQDEGGTWSVVNEGMTYRANQTKMELMLANLKQFTVLRVLSEQKSEYGLDESEALVRFTTTGGNTCTFMVGAASADVSNIYIKNVDDGRILLTGSASVAQLTGSLNAYRSKEVFTLNVANTRRIEYYNMGELIVSCYTEDGQSWSMDYPYKAPARAIELTEFVAAMKGWTVAGYPDPGVTAEAMGLSAPSEKIVVTDASGEAQTLEFGYEQGTARFARTGGTDDSIALYAVDVNLSVLRPDTLLFIAPLKAAMDEIASISIEANGETYVLTYDPATEHATLNGRPLEYEAFVRIYFKYISLVAAGYDGGGTPGKRLASFKTTFPDGRTASLELYERDDATCFMRIGGEEGYYLNAERLKALLARLYEVAGNG